MRIRKGDTVEVISGNWLGERGEVKRVVRGCKRKGRYVSQHDPDHDRVVVAGINLITKHQRPTGQVRTQAGRIQLEAALHVSNVSLVCPHCDQRTRVVMAQIADGRHARTCKKCGQYIDNM